MSGHSQSAVEHPASGPVLIYATVLGIGVACALAVVSVYEWTRPIIERNRQSQIHEAVFEVLPEARTIEKYQYVEATDTFESVREDASNASVIYAGFDEQGRLVGLALEAQGMGYQDRIRLLYGYSLARQAVTGIRVLESRETPGLGDRIEKDADFLRNFEALDVRLDEQTRQVAHPIEFVKAGSKTQAWQVDGITGATISSRAVAEMLRESTTLWVPRLQAQQQVFVTHQGDSP